MNILIAGAGSVWPRFGVRTCTLDREMVSSSSDAYWQIGTVYRIDSVFTLVLEKLIYRPEPSS